MCKYEMDLAGIVEDTDRTRFCPQTDRRKDKVKPAYPPSTSLSEGYNYFWSHESEKTPVVKYLL